MDYDIAFNLFFIQTKFLPGLTFPFVVLRNVGITEEDWITSKDWADQRTEMIRKLEVN